MTEEIGNVKGESGTPKQKFHDIAVKVGHVCVASGKVILGIASGLATITAAVVGVYQVVNIVSTTKAAKRIAALEAETIE